MCACDEGRECAKHRAELERHMAEAEREFLRPSYDHEGEWDVLFADLANHAQVNDG